MRLQSQFHRRPALDRTLLLISAVSLLALGGCAQESEGPGPQSDCATLASAARQAMEDELYRLSQAGEPEGPSDIDFAAADAAFQAALASCPDDEQVLFGAGMASMMAVTQDEEINGAFESWQAFIDTATIFQEHLPGPAPQMHLSLTGLAVQPGQPMPDAYGFLRAFAGLVTYAVADPPQIEELQALLETELLPRVDTAIGRMETIATHPDFTFMVSPRMQGDLEATPLELDLTEIYTLLTAADILHSFASLAASYSLNVASYDSAGLHQALQQASGFLALRPHGATLFANSRQRLLDALDAMEAAVDFLVAETDDQNDDIIVIDPEEGPTPEELEMIRDVLDQVRTRFTAPFEETYDFNGDELDEVVTFDLAAFFSDPPENLKELLPPYTCEVVVGEGGDLCPVLTWEADAFAEWIFPDPTMGGLLPEMTDETLKSTFGILEEDWEKVVDFCDAPVMRGLAVR